MSFFFPGSQLLSIYQKTTEITYHVFLELQEIMLKLSMKSGFGWKTMTTVLWKKNTYI